MKRLGKRGLMNSKSNFLLKKLFVSKGITRCEYPNCGSDYMLHFCHRKKRRHYLTVEELSDFNQVLLMCAYHDEMTEYKRDDLEELFIRLRGNVLK